MATSSDMPSSNLTRELAAIMFSDIAGYTAIMGRDEQEALRALDAHRGVLRTLLPKFNGRLVGEIGDGTLSSFHSAIDAVNCAREVQTRAEDSPELKLRIGIHLGDVVFSNNTVLGDGVNVASRIHALAPPGGICVSEHVYDEIRNKPGMRTKDLGRKKLKNVARPIRVYALAAQQPVVDRPAKTALPFRVAAAAAIGALALALVYGIARWRPVAFRTAEQSAASRPIRSIAVLPLDNFSGDPNQEYFADGMTDELITDLATISALRVISRTSIMRFKGEHRKPLPEIAKALNVDAVVEGSVLRIGNKVRITAQLIDASADKHLWAKSYERDSRDVLALQDELASAIAGEINVRLTPDERARLAGARQVNPEAHEAYLRGRYFLNEPSEERVRKAVEQFSDAIKEDPGFAPAYSGLADAYFFGADWYFPAIEMIPKARAAAERAVKLDETLAEAHTSLAFAYFMNCDWVGVDREFTRAIALNPSYAFAHDQYGLSLRYRGRFDEAVAESRRATELDPLSPIAAINASAALFRQGKLQEARAGLRKALNLAPGFYITQFAVGAGELAQGRLNEAIAPLEKAKAMDSPPFVAGYLGYAYAKAGHREKALAVLEELNQASLHRFVTPYCMAIIYLGLGDKARALDGLEKAYEVRSWFIPAIRDDTILDALRSDPRFIELLKKVGLDK